MKKIILDIKRKIYYLLHPSYYIRQKRWRNKNKENFTSLNSLSNNETLISCGKGTYGDIIAFNDSYDKTLCIGNYCSIGRNVVFIVSRDHRVNTISSFPFKQVLNLDNGKKYDSISKGNIIVDDDVWIGYNATILSGVHISQGAVIAAGAVVSNDVPPYAIVGGVPAKVLKYRFEEKIIDFLLTLDYNQLTEDMVKTHIEVLYKPIDKIKLNDVIELFDWFPKKII